VSVSVAAARRDATSPGSPSYPVIARQPPGPPPVIASGSARLTRVSTSSDSRSTVGLSKISIQTDTDLSLFNYDMSTGSGKARVGESQSSGSLKIVNGSAHTIKGEVSSGTIEIYN
jgi:hypothetical protein